MTVARALSRLLPAALSVAVVGCGFSSSASPTATAQPTIGANRTFRDTTQRYSFSFPANWHLEQVRTVQGVSVLPIAIPLSQAQVQVRVQRTRVSYADLPPGKNIKSNGNTVRYQHVRIANIPAIEIDTNGKRGLTQIVNVVNGPAHTYTVSVHTPSPPLEPRTIYGYRQIVSTLRVF